MPTAEYTVAGGPLRQSFLRAASECMLGAYYRSGNAYTSPPLDFGTVFHLVAAEILRTLKRQGESQIPTEEAMSILREVYAESKIVLPVNRDFGYEQLVWQVLRFCDHTWPSGRILFVERRLNTEVACPDGKLRVLTGQPDAIIADPPKGIVLVDWKSGRGRPPEPRDGDFSRDDGKPYLSPQGLFQLHVYGLQVMDEWKGLDYVILREFHTRWNLMREAKLYREELEHVRWEIGDLLMKLDTALHEGEDSEYWVAKPGSHCQWCPGKFTCPIPYDRRGEGAVVDAETAYEMGIRWTRADAAKSEADKALKAYIDAGGDAPQINEHEEVGWKYSHKEDGKVSRRFGINPIQADAA